MYTLYYHPRDDEGRPKSRGDLSRLPDAEEARELPLAEQARIHFMTGAAFGVPRADLERVWIERHGSIPEGV